MKPPVPEQIVTPSRLPPSGEVRVGGRVQSASGTRVVLADAHAEAQITLAAPGDLLRGDLCVVSATVRGGKLVDGRLDQLVHRPTEHLAEVLESRRMATGLAAALRKRAEVAATVRACFGARGYLEVETPALVPSPGLDLHLDAFAVEDIGWLGTSPEYQMKRLLAGGMPRIFQLGRCYRRAEVGSRHNPEFTMLEWYRAWATMEELMDETEDLVRAVLEKHAPATPGGCDVRQPFLRIPVAEAFERFAGIGRLESLRLASVDETEWFRLLVDRVEPGIAGTGVPVFLHDYPAPFASLARLRQSDLKVCERFELYVGDLELCNGFGELTDPYEQRGRFLNDQDRRREIGKPVHPLDERFLAALAEGMPPSAGNALGFDRLVLLCTGARSIGDVMAFPADWL
jgi:lysyl-tRNA synthetase class 2